DALELSLSGQRTLTVVDWRRCWSRHESAALIEFEACRIGLTCVYCRAVGAVQGRTACSRRSETLRRRRASLRRRGIDGTGRKRRCSISSWPSTILSSEIVGWPKGERCRGTSKIGRAHV